MDRATSAALLVGSISMTAPYRVVPGWNFDGARQRAKQNLEDIERRKAEAAKPALEAAEAKRERRRQKRLQIEARNTTT